MGLSIDEPLAILQGSTTDYYQADGLGSITSLSNSTGANTETYTYDSFGNLTASTGSLTNRYRYTGREFDSETGLYYYRARYYDPGEGRFLTEDRLRSISGTLDFYAYVENSATNLADPTGFCPTGKCPNKPDPQFRLVPTSDCSRPGQRSIVYELKGPGGSDPTCWWVTEHVDPKWLAPAAPARNSPEGQSTGDQNDDAGGFYDNLGGWYSGPSTQTFTISPQDPRLFPNTSSYPIIVQLPTGPNGQPQDFGKLAHDSRGPHGPHCINGNCTGWVPCKKQYDAARPLD